MAAGIRTWQCAACERRVPLEIDTCRCGAARPLPAAAVPVRLQRTASPRAARGSGSGWRFSEIGPVLRSALAPEYRRLTIGVTIGALLLLVALYRAVTAPPPPPIVPLLGSSVEGEQRQPPKPAAPSATPR
jgi:hypothetical protein